MKRLFCIFLFCAAAVLCSSLEENDDLKPEASQKRIYDIIQSHEGRKYGDHGGHEYNDDEPLRHRRKLARKPQRYAYLVGVDTEKDDEHPSRDYSETVPKRRPKDDVYRERVGPYSPKQPVEDHHASNDAPREYYVPKDEPKLEYYAVKKPLIKYYPTIKKEDPYSAEASGYHDDHEEESPLTQKHYVVADPKSHEEYVVIDPKPQRGYVIDPKHHYAADPKILPHASIPFYEPKRHPKVYEPLVHHVPSKYAHADHQYQVADKDHHEKGHGYYGDSEDHGESGHKKHGHHDIAGHQAHSSQAGHHDQHAKHHNKGSYERDRGYHYEKAYAYDRIRAHHDVGGSNGAHSAYQAQQGQQGHHDKGDHGAESHVYFKKKDNHHGGAHYLGNKEHHKKGHGGQGYYDYEVDHHHHPYGYGKL